ncbi:MAG TPA: NlpC/P60 family protein [Actinomycetota bacterium]|jgi:cell wall-associated NlpC family hydrolase
MRPKNDLMSPSTRRHLARAMGVALLAALLVIPSFVGTTASSFAAPSRSDVAAAEDRLEEIMDRESAVAEDLNQTQVRLDEIEKRMAVTSLEVDRIQKRIGDKVDAAETLAAELYKGGSAVTIEAVLAAEDLNDIESRIEYLQASQDSQLEVFERLAVDKQVLNEKLAQLDADKQQALEEEDRLADLEADLESQVADQKDEVERLSDLLARAERAATVAAEPAAAGPVPAPAPVNVNVDSNSAAGIAVQTALDQVGDPYVWAAAGPDSFDCSGLTMYAWAAAGVSLPHSSAMQYSATTRVSTSSLEPGDLLFYYSPVHHVAMYIGGGRMVEAPYSGLSVRVVPMRTSDLVGAGRPGV